MARLAWPRTLSRGPLAGQRFEGQQAYQNARARHFGFRSYADERAFKAHEPFTMIRERLIDRQGNSRSEALRRAKEIYGDRIIAKGPKQGKNSTRPAQEREKMRSVIAELYNSGLWDTGDEAADDMYYD